MAMASGDLYAVLGLHNGASPGEIRSAYRRLAMIWHPDKYDGRDPERAKRKFQQIHNAYAVLSDWKKRCSYDARVARYRQWQQSGLHRQRCCQSSADYGMSDFLGELMSMMQQQVDEEKNVSLEDLQATFSSMFDTTLNQTRSGEQGHARACQILRRHQEDDRRRVLRQPWTCHSIIADHRNKI